MSDTLNQTFHVSGMTCGHCERAVKSAILQADPNAQVRVDLASGQVNVKSAQARDVLEKAIADEGYTVAA